MAEATPPPRRREPGDRTGARLLAVAGLAGLLIVLVVVVTTISGAADGDDESEARATPSATETAAPEKTKEPEPTPEPLTADEEAERQEAIDLIATKSFEVTDPDDWNPDDTLQVLIGETTEGTELAFWFVDGAYLGNDSTDLSTKMKVKATDDIKVTLRYAIYEEDDEPGKPTGEPIDVDFVYDAGVVEPATALPAAEQRLK